MSDHYFKYVLYIYGYIMLVIILYTFPYKSLVCIQGHVIPAGGVFMCVAGFTDLLYGCILSPMDVRVC